MRTIYRFLREFGVDPLKTISASRNFFWYFSDYKKFKKNIKSSEWKIYLNSPCLHDKKDDAGIGKGHYFNQDLYVSQKIFKKNPKKHVDIGSSIYGFVSNVASFREIEVFDIRPLSTSFRNIIFRQQNLMNLDKEFENYSDSVSSLHVLEHFGLDRYGDPIDVNGYKKGFQNMVKILKKEGIFYFSVPIGKIQRIEFNAHRVFSIKEIINLAKENNLKVLSFSYVDDKGILHKDIELRKKEIENSLNLNWGCGIWEFKK